MTTSINFVLLGALSALAGGALMNLSDSDHWFIRGWDFPRVQIIVIAWLLMFAVFLNLWLGDRESTVPLWTSLGIAVALTGWHSFRIYPYTPIGSAQAKATPATEVRNHRNDPSAVGIVISNVKMENDQYERWIQTMQEADPDVLIVLEPNDAWAKSIESYTSEFSEQISIPQDNWYGMMMLSKLPIEKHRVRYLVQEDIPSIDAEVRLHNGHLMRVIGVHPRPPEPIRDNDATARDAELMLWGKELAEETRPTIIGGDLNDVAWSRTTRLFLRTSGMLDPRRGRGMFNTFHADRFWMRFPLDHIFLSPHFTINDVRLLSHVGSDHFPIQIELRHAPRLVDEHEVMTQNPGDEREAAEKIERAVEDDDIQGEAVESQDPDKVDAIET